MIKKDFIALLLSSAQECELKSGVPAHFTIAQAALESGWGESLLAKQGRNLFGVKADKSWHGDVLTLPTREVINGQWVTVSAKWRKYKTWQESIDDHAEFFKQNGRYAKCFECKTAEGFAIEVARAGYATDPVYGAKLVATIKALGI